MPPTDFHELVAERGREIGIDARILRRDMNVGFSGGEKKLAELLQMMLLEPRVAFLDEMDSGVDVDSLKKIFKGVRMLADKGTAFLLITHYGGILNHITPDAVHVMKKGRIVASGGHELVKEIEDGGYGMMKK